VAPQSGPVGLPWKEPPRANPCVDRGFVLRKNSKKIRLCIETDIVASRFVYGAGEIFCNWKLWGRKTRPVLSIYRESTIHKSDDRPTARVGPMTRTSFFIERKLYDSRHTRFLKGQFEVSLSGCCSWNAFFFFVCLSGR